MDDQLQELSQFLSTKTRQDIKTTALDYVLGLTGSDDGRVIISKHVSILDSLLDLTTDPAQDVSHNAYLALVNLSGDEQFASRLVNTDITPRLIQLLTAPALPRDAETICMILANITRLPEGAECFMTSLESPVTLYKLVDLFDKRDSLLLHYLASVFSNVTTKVSARLMFLDRQVCILPRLLPYMHYEGSTVRRGGIIGLVRNLCFDISSHEWLLSEGVDILSYLLLPLAGPEQFTEEENDSLPLDLQYLPDDKRREADPEMRIMLLEALMKLCATQHGRLYLRDKNAYLILRELDNWERDETITETVQTIIGILIADEPAPGMENLDELEIPTEIAEKLESVCEKEESDDENVGVIVFGGGTIKDKSVK